MGLRFAKGLEPWLNDRYPCRMPILDILHVVVDSKVMNWSQLSKTQEIGTLD